MKKLLSSLLLGATLLASGCTERKPDSSVVHSGMYAGYRVDVTEEMNGTNLFRKFVHLYSQESTNKYCSVSVSYLPSRDSTGDIEAVRRMPVCHMRFKSDYTYSIGGIMSRVDVVEAEEIKALLENAEREVKK